MFLTNNSNTLGLCGWLQQYCQVYLCCDRLDVYRVQALQPDFIISYNYIYLINEEIIQFMNGDVINLHISFLPWNRGVSPNIWSFIGHTPKGVTIHQVNTGFDTGRILYQKQCFFDAEKETFASVYRKLNQAADALFREKWDEIRFHRYVLTDQKGEGSYHSKKDLQVLRDQTEFKWDENIADFLLRYNKLKQQGSLSVR